MRKTIVVATFTFFFFFWFVQFALFTDLFFLVISSGQLFLKFLFYIEQLFNTNSCYNIFIIVEMLIPYISKIKYYTGTNHN